MGNRFGNPSLEQEYNDSEDPVPGIVQYLSQNPKPSDEELHAWAIANNMSPEYVEENLFALIGSLMKTMYKAASTPDDQFIPEQLARGIEVEKEHTDNEYVSKLIAKTHLLECETYYTGLDKVEKECAS